MIDVVSTPSPILWNILAVQYFENVGDFPDKCKGNVELSVARVLCQTLRGNISSYGVPSHTVR